MMIQEMITTDHRTAKPTTGINSKMWTVKDDLQFPDFNFQFTVGWML